MSDPERGSLHQSATSSSDRDDSPPSPPTSPPAEPQPAPPSPVGSGQAPPGQTGQQQATGTLSTSVDSAASSSSTPVGATPSGSGHNIWAPPSNTSTFALPPTSGTSRPASQRASLTPTALPTRQDMPDNAALVGNPQGTAQPNPTPPLPPTDVQAPAPDEEVGTFPPGAPIIRDRRTMMPPLYMLQESVVVDTLALYCIMPNCQLMFPSRGEHDEHLNVVHGVGRYRCHGCTESFLRSEALGCHVRHHHRALNGNWRCPECGKIYRTHNKLHTHIYRYHYKGLFKCYHPGCAFGPSNYRDDVYRHFYREHNIQATRRQYRLGHVEFA